MRYEKGQVDFSEVILYVIAIILFIGAMIAFFYTYIDVKIKVESDDFGRTAAQFSENMIKTEISSKPWLFDSSKLEELDEKITEPVRACEIGAKITIEDLTDSKRWSFGYEGFSISPSGIENSKTYKYPIMILRDGRTDPAVLEMELTKDITTKSACLAERAWLHEREYMSMACTETPCDVDMRKVDNKLCVDRVCRELPDFMSSATIDAKNLVLKKSLNTVVATRDGNVIKIGVKNV